MATSRCSVGFQRLDSFSDVQVEPRVVSQGGVFVLFHHEALIAESDSKPHPATVEHNKAQRDGDVSVVQPQATSGPGASTWPVKPFHAAR